MAAGKGSGHDEKGAWTISMGRKKKETLCKGKGDCSGVGLIAQKGPPGKSRAG